MPLIMLVFPNNNLAFSIQIIMVVIQTTLPFTFGMITINSSMKSKKQLFMELTHMPVIYAMILGVVFHLLDVPLPEPVVTPLDYIVNGFIAIALITLGLQLGTIRWKFDLKQVLGVNTIRLIISPVLAFLLVYVMGMSGVMAQVFIISSAVPTALNVVLLEIEYDNQPEFSSQIVLSSTILSMFTMTAVIYLSQLYFS
nr:AEC family transporter [Alteribacillus sp. YIM 98480]